MEPTIYHTQGQHPNNYIVNADYFKWSQVNFSKQDI